MTAEEHVDEQLWDAFRLWLGVVLVSATVGPLVMFAADSSPAWEALLLVVYAAFFAGVVEVLLMLARGRILDLAIDSDDPVRARWLLVLARPSVLEAVVVLGGSLLFVGAVLL